MYCQPNLSRASKRPNFRGKGILFNSIAGQSISVFGTEPDFLWSTSELKFGQCLNPISLSDKPIVISYNSPSQGMSWDFFSSDDPEGFIPFETTPRTLEPAVESSHSSHG